MMGFKITCGICGEDALMSTVHNDDEQWVRFRCTVCGNKEDY